MYDVGSQINVRWMITRSQRAEQLRDVTWFQLLPSTQHSSYRRSQILFVTIVTMELLALFHGDTIIFQYVWLDIHFRSLLTMIYSGKKRHDTVLICLSSDDVEEGCTNEQSCSQQLTSQTWWSSQRSPMSWHQIQQTCAYFTLWWFHWRTKQKRLRCLSKPIFPWRYIIFVFIRYNPEEICHS